MTNYDVSLRELVIPGNCIINLFKLKYQWYKLTIIALLMRYKLFIVFMLLLFLPSFSSLLYLVNVLTGVMSSAIILSHYAGYGLLSCHLIGMLWIILHHSILYRGPWAKYLSSLPINYFHLLLSEVAMLLLVDFILFVPVFIVMAVGLLTEKFSISVLFGATNSLIILMTVVLTQLSILRKKYLFIFAFISSDLILIGLPNFQIPNYLFIVLALIPIFISIFCFILLRAARNLGYFSNSVGRLSILQVNKHNHGNQYFSHFNNPCMFWSILKMNINHLLRILPRLIMILIGISGVIAIGITIIFYNQDNSNLLMIVSNLMLINCFIVSNVFKILHQEWSQYLNFFNSLPIKKSSLFYANLFIVALFALLTNIIFIILILYFRLTTLYHVASTLLLTLLFLITAYLPHIYFGRYGIFLSFCLMLLFSYIGSWMIA